MPVYEQVPPALAGGAGSIDLPLLPGGRGVVRLRHDGRVVVVVLHGEASGVRVVCIEGVEAACDEDVRLGVRLSQGGRHARRGVIGAGDGGAVQPEVVSRVVVEAVDAPQGVDVQLLVGVGGLDVPLERALLAVGVGGHVQRLAGVLVYKKKPLALIGGAGGIYLPLLPGGCGVVRLHHDGCVVVVALHGQALGVLAVGVDHTGAAYA